MVQFCLPTVVILMKMPLWPLKGKNNTLSGLAKAHWLSKGSVHEHINLLVSVLKASLWLAQNSKHRIQGFLSKFP